MLDNHALREFAHQNLVGILLRDPMFTVIETDHSDAEPTVVNCSFENQPYERNLRKVVERVSIYRGNGEDEHVIFWDMLDRLIEKIYYRLFKLIYDYGTFNIRLDNIKLTLGTFQLSVDDRKVRLFFPYLWTLKGNMDRNIDSPYLMRRINQCEVVAEEIFELRIKRDNCEL